MKHSRNIAVLVLVVILPGVHSTLTKVGDCLTGVGSGADAEAACAANGMNCCVDPTGVLGPACVWNSRPVTRLCDNSCVFWNTCKLADGNGAIDIGLGSCTGGSSACWESQGKVGDYSCNSVFLACHGAVEVGCNVPSCGFGATCPGTACVITPSPTPAPTTVLPTVQPMFTKVGDCLTGVGSGADAEAACAANGMNCCVDPTGVLGPACVWNSRTVTRLCDNSCVTWNTCNLADGNGAIDIGRGSCTGGSSACAGSQGKVGDNSCNSMFLACNGAVEVGCNVPSCGFGATCPGTACPTTPSPTPAPTTILPTPPPPPPMFTKVGDCLTGVGSGADAAIACVANGMNCCIGISFSGDPACIWNSRTVTNLCEQSCIGTSSCQFVGSGPVTVGKGSCLGSRACHDSHGNVGENSCTGAATCLGAVEVGCNVASCGSGATCPGTGCPTTEAMLTKVGDCLTGVGSGADVAAACAANGMNCCVDQGFGPACIWGSRIVTQFCAHSCIGLRTCDFEGSGPIDIGRGSCTIGGACFHSHGKVGFNSCTEVLSCEGAVDVGCNVPSCGFGATCPGTACPTTPSPTPASTTILPTPPPPPPMFTKVGDCLTGVGSGADAAIACAANGMNCCIGSSFSGDPACIWNSRTVTELCEQSCIGTSSCQFVGSGPVNVGKGSCIGNQACMDSHGNVGENSCVGADTCSGAVEVGCNVAECQSGSTCPGTECPTTEPMLTKVGDCLTGVGSGADVAAACIDNGLNCCVDQGFGPACIWGSRIVTQFCDHSCIGLNTCNFEGSGPIDVGIGSCTIGGACFLSHGKVGFNSCTGVLSCQGAVDVGCNVPSCGFGATCPGTCPQTDPPTEPPTLPPAGANGDPHFKTFSGHPFDFHGACDLVLIHAPKFGQGLGLDIQIRTQVRYKYSYIESAALKIGDDILEVGSWGEYFFNGVEGIQFPTTMAAGFAMIIHEQINKKAHRFEIDLDGMTKIVVRTFKDLVSVSVGHTLATKDIFEGSVGMLGAGNNGQMLARDGITLLSSDPDAFGNEWQVRDTEAKIFQNVDRYPQYPDACVMPKDDDSGKKSALGRSRRLGESAISEEQAMDACKKEGRINDLDTCLYDVMATGDLEVAQAGWF